jgi:metal-sulfur cluster biosynthetic enzyme
MNSQEEISHSLHVDPLWKALETVIDPEMYISIVDLGLVYDVEQSEAGSVLVTMTLTTIGCPLFPVIEKDITNAIGAVPGTAGVKINLVFDPPWNVDLMTEKGKAILGI